MMLSLFFNYCTVFTDCNALPVFIYWATCQSKMFDATSRFNCVVSEKLTIIAGVNRRVFVGERGEEEVATCSETGFSVDMGDGATGSAIPENDPLVRLLACLVESTPPYLK